MQVRFLAFAVVVFLGSATSRLQAQLVVNSLRGGWQDAELGWSGNINAGLTLSRGNADYTLFSAGGALQLLGSRHRVRGLVSERLLRAGGEEVSEDFVVHLRHNYRLGENSALSTVVLVQTQHAPFWRIDRRTLLGAGGRWDVVRQESLDVSVGATLMVEWERLTEELGRVSETDYRGSYFLSVIARPNEGVRLDLSAFYQPRFADFSDARLFATVQTTLALVGSLRLTTALEFLHDTEPAQGVEPTEVLFQSGLQLGF